MRKNWLLIAIGLLVAVLAIGAVACDDDEDDDDENGAAIPPAAAEIALIVLSEQDGSGVTGSATMSETSSGGVEVSVTIDGGLEEGAHQNHLHHGTCDAQGEVHVGLEELAAGADGAASATSSIDDPAFGHWLERDHYVAAHALDGAVVTCGDVEAL